jgi:LEA14-like dessication related protein
MQTNFSSISYRFIAILTMIFLLISSCSIKDAVKVTSIKDVRPNMENRVFFLNASLEIENTNFYNVTIKPSKISVSIDDKQLGELKLIDKVVLSSKSKETYPLKFQFQLSEGALFKIMSNVLKRDVNLTFKGKIKTKALGLPIPIQIDETKLFDGSLLNLFGKLN